ncbi:flagellar hook-associated family protein [Rhizobium sp. CFBP 8762]|uniref:flagellar hook-associated family protein n=1 Tax=Rhizobium sp. CFBP 8762 TaxID=2775279 RepID=UPI00178583D8|nr:flagellar hook-associated family protein [Rhizobium sp. CFBP 8762]MBD8553448.1 flagellar hook-associated family protein [Rhizobium sp. CFBP 8762]
MRTSLVSNVSIQNSMRLTVRDAQAGLLKASAEAATGRHADVGLALGALTSQSLNLNRDVDRLTAIKTANALSESQMKTTQDALTNLQTNATGASKDLIVFATSESSTDLTNLKKSMASALSSFVGSVNSYSQNEFIFGGINTGTPPIKENAIEDAKKAIQDLYKVEFTDKGKTDQSITSGEMATFITKVEKLFIGEGNKWADIVSNASDTNMSSRISTTEVVQTSTNANSDGMRRYVLGALLAHEMADKDISGAVRGTVNKAAQGYMSTSITDLISDGSTIGTSQERLTTANKSIDNQVKIYKTHLLTLEGVDPYEASTLVKTLKAQVDTSYTLTAMLQKLSLLNYL